MTAPSAPGVALYEGAWGVTREESPSAWERIQGPMVYEAASDFEFVSNAGCYRSDGRFGYGHERGLWWPEGADIIHVEPTREAAEAWLRESRDAQDAEPERRRAVAEVPADDDGWGPWRTDVSEWNVTTHDVRFECVGGIHKISTRPRTEQPPQPEAAPTPAPDWEALVAALKPFAKAWEVAMLSSSGGRGLSSGQLGALAAHEVAGVHFQRAAALIAAMQEPKS